jgi:maleate isomerase
VAIMSMGFGYHIKSQKRLTQCTIKNGNPAAVITSAGALIEGLRALKAKNIALLSPYMKNLAQTVVSYIENEGFIVNDWHTLEIPNNLDVAAHDSSNLIDHAKKLNLDNVDVLVVSACVQMPSLRIIPELEKEIGKPVISAAVCTVFSILKSLNLSTSVPNGGRLLTGDY